jgi:hypothetical protein
VSQVAVALISGAAGALIVALLRVRHERDDRLRERMLVASDDFLSAHSALATKTITINRHWRAGRDDVAPEILNDLFDGWDSLYALLARTNLLFGYATPAGWEAQQMVFFLREEIFALERRDFKDAMKQGLQSWNAQIEFSQNVRRALRRGPYIGPAINAYANWRWARASTGYMPGHGPDPEHPEPKVPLVKRLRGETKPRQLASEPDADDAATDEQP